MPSSEKSRYDHFLSFFLSPIVGINSICAKGSNCVTVRRALWDLMKKGHGGRGVAGFGGWWPAGQCVDSGQYYVLSDLLSSVAVRSK
eukprot:scaffold4233_cov142-Skeletonema_dohrnii-CCMP3373.AAC.13